MNTWRYLTDADLMGLYWPGVVAGLAVAGVGALLSVLVVLRRLAFIGQGVSHAAFGGVGLVAVLGLVVAEGITPTLLGTPVSPQVGTALAFAVIVTVCLGSALLIGAMSARGSVEPDTAVGIVLVGMMALGAILLEVSGSTLSWESFLFGSVMGLEWTDAALAWGVGLAIVVAAWWARRPLLFWAFDPEVARAMGVRDGAMRTLVMTMLALAVVTAMKLAGVVLATAVLVLPGAIALRLSDRLGRVLGLALAAGLLGVVAGVVVSFETDWPTGPCIVGVLAGAYALARLAGTRRTAA